MIPFGAKALVVLIELYILNIECIAQVHILQIFPSVGCTVSNQHSLSLKILKIVKICMNLLKIFVTFFYDASIYLSRVNLSC